MNNSKEINLALKEFSEGKKVLAYKKLKKIFKKNQLDDQLRFNLAVIEQTLNLNEESKNNYLSLKLFWLAEKKIIYGPSQLLFDN